MSKLPLEKVVEILEKRILEIDDTISDYNSEALLAIAKAVEELRITKNCIELEKNLNETK